MNLVHERIFVTYINFTGNSYFIDCRDSQDVSELIYVCGSWIDYTAITNKRLFVEFHKVCDYGYSDIWKLFNH